MNPVDEPLALSAPLARRLAPTLCRQDPATGERCSWNHGLWQVLRLMGLVLTPAHHADFFQDALEARPVTTTSLRVLVSGAADYGMLAQVLAALRPRNVAAEITVLDVCETPLMLNRWYADHLGQRVQTVRSEILDYDPPGLFDVVCTHAFLAMFPRERRPALLAKWHQLLRPGGAAITVNRVRPAPAATAPVTFGAEEARAFRDLVRERAATLPASLELDPETLAREAEVYASRQHIHPVRSREEVQELFEGAGFWLEHLSCAPLARGPHQVTGPTVPSVADYARVIARRR